MPAGRQRSGALSLTDEIGSGGRPVSTSTALSMRAVRLDSRRDRRSLRGRLSGRHRRRHLVAQFRGWRKDRPRNLHNGAGRTQIPGTLPGARARQVRHIGRAEPCYRGPVLALPAERTAGCSAGAGSCDHDLRVNLPALDEPGLAPDERLKRLQGSQTWPDFGLRVLFESEVSIGWKATRRPSGVT